MSHAHGRRELLRKLGREWTLDGYTGTGHLRLRHGPTGVTVIASSTPSCPREQANTLATARRLVCQARERRAA